MDYQSFIGPSYESQGITADGERLVNWYTERLESPGAPSRWALYPTPGVSALTLTLPTIATPGAPVVTNQGAAGATAYAYKIVALLGDGTTHTEAGAAGSTATGNATLDGTNFNRLTWTALTNAVSYVVYRTTGGAAPPKKLATVTAATYDDIGTAGTAETPPTTNTTGVAVTPNGPGRGHFFLDEREFLVLGTIFYELSENGTITPRGVVSLDTNPATISSNGDAGGQIFITSGGNGYIFTLSTNAFAQVTALNGKATMGDHIDGYFLALNVNTSTFYISSLLDGTTWATGTDFAQRSKAPDPWKSMRVLGSYVWLLGERTSEVWYNTGAASFPFAVHPSGLISYGIASAFSVAVSGRELTWLSTSLVGGLQVMRTSGFTPEGISSLPVQTAFGDYTTVSDAVADTYQERGHTFYVITFPTENHSWAWDEQTRHWHERGTWDPSDNAFTALRPRWHAYAFNQHRMLDGTTGNIYRMSATLGGDVDGLSIRRLRRGPGLNRELERIFYASLELGLDVGLGLETGQGSDPMVMMRMSDDGGKTWGIEHMRSAGKIGEYDHRVRWDRLGASRRRVFEISVTDPIPWRITGAYLTFAQPPSGMGAEQRQAQQEGA